MTGGMRVGTFHEVPCVRTIWPGQDALYQNIEWIPVLGPPHEDSGVINFPRRHWHVDRRFLTERKLRETTQEGAKLDEAFRMPVSKVWPEHPGLPATGTRVCLLPARGIPGESYLRVMRRRMSQPYPGYPGPDLIPWLAALHEEFMEARLGENLVCPHRGAPLAGMELDQEVCVTCPMHGLRWNAATGELAPAPAVRRVMDCLMSEDGD